MLVAFFIVRSGLGEARAGEQLTIEQLMKDAVGVALVDNPLNSNHAVRHWVEGYEPVGQFTLVSPLCIPDKDMLLRWKKQSPKHAGAPVWDRTLSVGHTDQLVFFTVTKGMAVPRCETEVMLGETFSTHPNYKATLAAVERMVREKRGIPEPAPPSLPPAAIEEPVVEPVTAKKKPAQAPSGCW